MRRPFTRLAAALALAAAMAVFTNSAAAGGNGNGNGQATAPGQVKQEQTAAQPAAPAQQQAAPGQAKKASTSASVSVSTSASAKHESKGQAKHQAAVSSSSSTQAGVKPSSTSAHWTHTTVGAKPDVSKRYGNGNTAAQIAHSRGAPDSQPLTGPGNSQPHKTFDCRHKNNKSGGVDVHAIKSYDVSCQQQTQPQQAQQQVQIQSSCPQTTIASTSTQVVGVLHGKHQHLMTNTHSAHFTKHNDTKVTASVTSTQVVPTGANCGSVQASQSSRQSVQSSQSVQSTQSAQQPTQVSALSALQGKPSTSAPATQSAQGGVLGAQTSLAKPKSKRGVLGTVTHVAGTSLPFTGFPLWAAVVTALALLGAGFGLRRRAAASRL